MCILGRRGWREFVAGLVLGDSQQCLREVEYGSVTECFGKFLSGARCIKGKSLFHWPRSSGHRCVSDICGAVVRSCLWVQTGSEESYLCLLALSHSAALPNSCLYPEEAVCAFLRTLGLGVLCWGYFLLTDKSDLHLLMTNLRCQ